MGGERATSVPLVGGRYELEALLGKGGGGEVWRARHVTLDSYVAIKFLHGPSADSEASRKRFVSEARITAQLRTRYAVHVFDHGITDDGRPYLVMELLDGETLGHRLDRLTRLSPNVVVRLLSQAARALDRAHSLGIVHRDLKPENIVIVTDDESKEESVKVLDFGVAKLVGQLASGSSSEAADTIFDARLDPLSSTSLTRTGGLIGTPRYMAPEQILGLPDLDVRADIWALGVVAFECLTGEPPFTGNGLTDLFSNIQSGVHARAQAIHPELPASVDAWFDVACATDPASRFSSATIAVVELARALGEPPDSQLARASEPPVELPRETPAAAKMRAAPSPSAGTLRSREAAFAATLDDAFREPPWDAPLDVQTCIDAIPANATTKGFFTIPMVAEAQRRGFPLKTARDRYLPFFDYPLAEHVTILAEYSRALFPDISLRQALRKIGRQAYGIFVESLLGKVLWAHVDSVGDGLEMAMKSYLLLSPSSRVTLVENGAGRARVHLERVHYFLDCNHVGVFEGVLRTFTPKGKVLVRLDSPTSGEFLLTW